MSLESEIKKLTEAVLALNANMSGQPAGFDAPPVMQQPAQQFAPPVMQQPAQQFAPPVMQQPAQQFAPPVMQQPAQQFTPPVMQQPQAGAMTHADAQRELGGVMQVLGSAAAPQLQQLIAQYGNGATTLSAVPAQNLPQLVQVAKALVQ